MSSRRLGRVPEIFGMEHGGFRKDMLSFQTDVLSFGNEGLAGNMRSAFVLVLLLVLVLENQGQISRTRTRTRTRRIAFGSFRPGPTDVFPVWTDMLSFGNDVLSF
jgi:hypothetical protein